MSIENQIKDVITAKLEEGIVEKLVAENLEKGINEALKNLLGSYGDITKIIEKQIKEVMLSQLSSYDYSKYVVKLDCVLTEILKKTALDHKKILENFKELMIEGSIPKAIKTSEIFEKYEKFVAANVNTDGLEVCFDDGLSYEDVAVSMEVEHEDKRSWSSFEHAKIVLECAKDQDLNCEIRISRYDKFPWSIDNKTDTSINSLRHLSEFEIYLLKIYQVGAKIEIDKQCMEDEVTPEKEPEAEFR